MRPETLQEFVGQTHILGAGKLLRLAIKKDELPSMIFWGPPGSGKTTLAHIIAKETKSRFVKLSAVSSGVQDVRMVVKEAQESNRLGEKTILFVDEVHRFNKAQQDGFLPHVEDGTLVLCHLSGRLRMNFIKILPGDKVRMEMTPYDLTKGRIVYRYR